MAKFYFVRFTEKSSKKILYKFGWTQQDDVMSRFDPYLSGARFFDDRKRYLEFDIKV